MGPGPQEVMPHTVPKDSLRHQQPPGACLLCALILLLVFTKNSHRISGKRGRPALAKPRSLTPNRPLCAPDPQHPVFLRRTSRFADLSNALAEAYGDVLVH